MPQLTEEEIRRMSPEQILQLQKQNCIFCQIISGKVPAKKVYETQVLIGLLDINPASLGHVILLTKEHYQIMPLIPDDAIGELFIGAKLISKVMLKSLQAQGTTIFAANGTVAGQRAPHFMLHIIPRMEGDGVAMEIPALNASHNSVALLLSSKIREAFGAEGGEEAEQNKNEEETPEKVSIHQEPEKMQVSHDGKKGQKAGKKHEPEGKEDKKAGSQINLDELADFMFSKPQV